MGEEQQQVIGSIEGLPREDKIQIISNKLSYLSGGAAVVNLGNYEVTLKRRHGAKKLIG